MNAIDLAAWLSLIAAVIGPVLLIAVLWEAVNVFSDQDE
jgi:hypothetical protein